MMQNIWPKSFIGLPETLSSVPFRLWFIQTTWVTIYYTVKTHFTAFSSLTLFHYLASEPRSVLNTAPFPSNWIKRCCPPPLTAAAAATSVLPFRSVPVSCWMDDGCVAYLLPALDCKTEILNLAPIQIIIKAHLAYFQSLHKFSSSRRVGTYLDESTNAIESGPDQTCSSVRQALPTSNT